MSGLAVSGTLGGDFDSARAVHPESSQLRHRDLETVRRRLVRLAFDIHDGPLQSLAAAGFGLKDLHGRVSALLPDTTERDTAGKLIVELIDELSETERALRIEALLREALTNIAKHSRASNVTIRIQTSSTQVLLEVEDDGCGFDPGLLEEATMGLTSMRERVKLIGGEFEILSRQGGPTLVTATLRRWQRALPTAAAYTSPPIAAKL